jgi:hypothetical protein
MIWSIIVSLTWCFFVPGPSEVEHVSTLVAYILTMYPIQKYYDWLLSTKSNNVEKYWKMSNNPVGVNFWFHIDIKIFSMRYYNSLKNDCRAKLARS